MYFHELDRKEHLEKSTTLPIGIIVASFGLIGYFFTHFRFGGVQYLFSCSVDAIFYFASAAATILLATTTYWCIRTVTGSTYEYLPGAETIRQYRRDLESWHELNRTKNGAKAAKNDFQEFIANALARCSQKNWQTNLVRSEELYRTKRFTVFSLVALTFAAFAYYIDFWFEPSPIGNI